METTEQKIEKLEKKIRIALPTAIAGVVLGALALSYVFVLLKPTK